MMEFGLIIEMVVAALLVVTIVFCFVLDRRLRALRSGQDGLKQVISALDSATHRAQDSISNLARLGEAADSNLKETISEARRLSDELGLMIESANRIADRLEDTTPASGQKRSVPSAEKITRLEASSATGPSSALLDALRNAR